MHSKHCKTLTWKNCSHPNPAFFPRQAGVSWKWISLRCSPCVCVLLVLVTDCPELYRSVKQLQLQVQFGNFSTACVPPSMLCTPLQLPTAAFLKSPVSCMYCLWSQCECSELNDKSCQESPWNHSTQWLTCLPLQVHWTISARQIWKRELLHKLFNWKKTA